VLRYRWTNVVPGFDMPVRASLGTAGERLLHPKEAWTTEQASGISASDVKVDANFYVMPREIR
jgi:hypothetical protein